MNLEELKAYCLEKPGAYCDCPFGEYPVCCKAGGRIFAQLYDDGRMTVKCSPDQAREDREKYPEAAVQTENGENWIRWNTVFWEKLPAEAVYTMLDRSYAHVMNGLSRSAREEVLNPPPPKPAKGFWKRK